MTDIKDLIDALQSDMTSVKEQIDVLDEAELNGISEQVTSVNESVEYIKELISDVTTTVTVAGDATAAFAEGGKVVGQTSGAEGVVSVATYDADADVTTVTLSNTKGVFEVEDVTAVDGSTQTLTGATVAGSAVDSVMEFVNALNDSIAAGNDSLNVIKTYTDNLELMLEGKEYTDTEGNVVSADDSKGLAEIYAEITANGVSIADANTAIANLDTKVGDIQTSVEGKIADVQAAVDALTDADNADSLVSKINAIKTVVDANEATLEDEGYGLEAIKGLIDTANSSIDSLVADFADGGRLEVRFDDLDTAVANVSDAVADARTAIQDDIANLSSSLDDKYAALDGKLDALSSAQSYKGFV
jgi:peptidoglycan hydrolase CwlO-like protein